MKVSLQWLNDFVKIPKGVKPKELADRLTNIGIEVEEIISLGEGLDGVLTAKVKEVQKHPNADKLSLCQVDDGQTVHSVVCGAPNVRKGLLVAFAPIGTSLPNGMKIKKAKIRGESSSGMICSESELHLSEESQGIMELPANTPLGKPLPKVLELKDTVFDVAITPNRPDCLGHLGVAREIAAIFGVKITLPKTSLGKIYPNQGLEVQIKDLKGCPAYLGRMITDIHISPSPWSVQRRLQAVGLRPINQVVDATNYVLMELGHPTHAFDQRFIRGNKIVVKKAKAKEKFVTLDEKEQKLTNQDLMICDAKGSVALAGIMGGENSGIRDDTKALILECAYFNPTFIRLSSRRLGLISDSSYRFERGVDPFVLTFAMDRLAYLIQLWTEKANYPKPKIHKVVAKTGKLPINAPVPLSYDFLEKRLGLAIKKEKVSKILTSLGLKRKSVSSQKVIWQIPSFRIDLTRPIDLVEEVARHFSFEKIPTTLPHAIIRPVELPEIYSLKNEISETLRQYGFSEAIQYSFVPGNDPEKLNLKNSLKPLSLKNPIAEDQAVMRTMLTPGLLRTVAYNLNRGIEDIRLFECNKVFIGQNSNSSVSEKFALAAVMVGGRYQISWNQNSVPVDFFDLKGALEGLFGSFSGLQIDFSALKQQKSQIEDYSFLHPGLSVLLKTSNQVVLGWMGAIHPEVLERFDLKKSVFAFELDLEFLQTLLKTKRAFSAIPQYPASRRDLAIVVPEDMPAKRIYDLIFSMKNNIIDQVQLFDVYKGDQVGEGKKSLAYAVHYLSRERTLTSEEIDSLHQKIIDRLGKDLGAEIRT